VELHFDLVLYFFILHKVFICVKLLTLGLRISALSCAASVKLLHHTHTNAVTERVRG